ncbi:hypothetical protein LJR231_002748 [Phyllobacterium sp. LjRoot231]|uniref:hypothetical protein n=1 Tax=Phyllobacterium sp. LjRoot231 TaxID=3342289 RepID=UPI003ED03F2E
MSETPKPAYPDHMEKAPAGLFEHYCMHEGCKAWGSFGFDKRYGLEWYCGEHKSDAGD